MTVEEADGTTLLDNSMVLYGSGISDGDRHDHVNLPVIVLGKGGGTLRTGQHLKCRPETPMSNLLLAMLQAGGRPGRSLRRQHRAAAGPAGMMAIRGRGSRTTFHRMSGERAIAVWIRNLSWALLVGRRLVERNRQSRAPGSPTSQRARPDRPDDRESAGRETGRSPRRGQQGSAGRPERAAAGVAGVDRSA